MTALLEVACRFVLRLAGRLVPASSYLTWREDWENDYWHWLRKAKAHQSADGRAALFIHTKGAVWAALSALRTDAELTRRRDYWTGHPAFPVAVLSAAALALVLWSGGLRETRRLLQPARLPVADSLVLLSQTRPYLGSRRGFSSVETEVFAKQGDTVESVARQQWYSAKVKEGGRSVQRAASNVGPGFFGVMGVTAGLGKLPTANDEFSVSQDYWRDVLKGDITSLGRSYSIDGRKMRLVGVLPRDFQFLSPIDIWTARTEDPPPPIDPKLQRFYGLKGVVARLKPNTTAASAEFELFTILDRRNMGHYTFEVNVAPYADFITRNLRIYGTGFLAALLLAIIGVGSAYFRQVKEGAAPASARKYWGLLLAKVVLGITLSFLFVMETTGLNRQGLMGGVWFGRDLFSIWLFLTGAVVLGLWAWRDQRNRCHVCLHKLRDPVRIGIPGQVLLETTGLELMCPKGHGILYSPESVLGSEMSEHWLGLGLDFEPVDLKESAEP